MEAWRVEGAGRSDVEREQTRSARCPPKVPFRARSVPVSTEKVQILKSEPTVLGRLPFLANVCASTPTVVDDFSIHGEVGTSHVGISTNL